MTIDYKALGAKIKEYRKKENITQEQLAEMADISLSHMSNIETASASVSLPALKLIADALDVTLDELLIDSYSKKQKEYLYSRKLECILEQCETVEQEIFLVTSAMPGEGKSTVSANIAISLAMKGYKVILVDADLRNPSTAKVLGMQEQEHYRY